jgi:type VI secretion system protein ImpG
VGFDDAQALLPVTARAFQGYRLLQEYFALPERFSFVELRGLRSVLRGCRHAEVELVLLLDRHEPAVEAGARREHAQLFCSPAANLFELRTDRIALSDRAHEYHVVPDRTRPLDYEVHSVLEVVAHGSEGDAPRPFLPFYADVARGGPGVGYFSVQRRPRAASARERAGAEPSYAGSETYLSLVDASKGPYQPTSSQLSVRALCTNRALPLSLLRSGAPPSFRLEVASPVSAVHTLAGPSAPQPSQAWGDSSWRLIARLSCNHLSLVGEGGGDGAAVLRELLELHADPSSVIAARQIGRSRACAPSPARRSSAGCPCPVPPALPAAWRCSSRVMRQPSRG